MYDSWLMITRWVADAIYEFGYNRLVQVVEKKVYGDEDALGPDNEVNNAFWITLGSRLHM